MVPPVVGMVLVESTWVRQTGMSALFERVPESKGPSGDVRIICVTSYNISDGNLCRNSLLPQSVGGSLGEGVCSKQEVIANSSWLGRYGKWWAYKLGYIEEQGDSF